MTIEATKIRIMGLSCTSARSPEPQLPGTRQNNRMKHFALVVASLALVGSAYADMFKPSKADQVKLGQRAASDIRKKEKTLPESNVRVSMIRRIGQRLLGTLNDSKEPWKYSFDVVDKKDLNAFALPGGPVFFYNGILDQMKTEDQIAGVMAHEITHVRKEHWAYAYGESQKRGLGISLLLIIFRANRAAFDIASVGNDLLFELPFSRKHETEADNLGYDMMVSAGFNPDGIAEVFEMLQAKTKGGKPPEFLSTHPDDAKRVTRLRDRIAKDRASGKVFANSIAVPWTTATAGTTGGK